VYRQVLKHEQARATVSFLTPWEEQITSQAQFAGKVIESHSIHSFFLAEGKTFLAT